MQRNKIERSFSHNRLVKGQGLGVARQRHNPEYYPINSRKYQVVERNQPFRDQIPRLKSKESRNQPTSELAIVNKNTYNPIKTDREAKDISTYNLMKVNSEKQLLPSSKPKLKIEDIQRKHHRMMERTEHLRQRLETLVDKGKSKQKNKHLNLYSPRYSVYYVSAASRCSFNKHSPFYQHLDKTLSFVKYFEEMKLIRIYSKELFKKSLNLPKKPQYADKKTIIFDLDETLIHSTEQPTENYDERVKIKPGKNAQPTYVHVRPHAKELLRRLSYKFQIMVFTASQPIYADQMIKIIDPGEELIQHRLYRKDCIHLKDNLYMKDLRILNRRLEDVVLVDNFAYSYQLQRDNGIPIIPYYCGKEDNELRFLESYLESLLFCRDVREKNRKTFQLHRYEEFETVPDLVSTLYRG